MFRKEFVLAKPRVLHYLLFGILCMVIGAFFTVMAYNSRIPAAQAAPLLQGPSLPDVPEGGASRSCTINNIFVDAVRVDVTCATANPAGVYFFMIQADAAHQLMANRFLALLNTAVAMNKPVTIVYDTDTAHNPPSCLAADCRLLMSVYIAP